MPWLICNFQLQGWHLPAGNFEYYKFSNITEIKELGIAIAGYLARIMSLIQHKEMEIQSVAGADGQACLDFLINVQLF